MTQISVFRLPEAVVLPGDITVHLGLTFMPEQSADGTFKMCAVGEEQPEIHLEFTRSGVVFDTTLWNGTVDQKGPIELADGTELGSEALSELDRSGWMILRGYGMRPNVWVDPRH